MCSIPSVLLMALLGCGGAGDSAPRHSDPDVPVDGDTLVWAVPFDPGNANPLVAPYALSAMVIDLVQPGLAHRDVGDAGMTYTPALATSWAWNDDGTSLTYTLRDDVFWEDGTAVTSADVAFTHQLIADPAVASNWHRDASFVAAVETPDPQTVVFRFTGRKNPILQQGYTFRGIVPQHALADADRATLRGHASARAPTASGPFRIAKWVPDDKVVLEPNPKASSEWKPRLDRIILRVLPEYATRVIELERGNADLLTSVEFEDVKRLRDHPDLRLERLPANSMQYIGYKLSEPVFADIRVREALTRGTDRNKLIADLLTVDGDVYGRHCTGTISPALGAWDADIEPLPYDPAAAKALLDAAGWVDTDGDGVRDKDGQPLSFQLMVQNGIKQLKKIAVLTQAQWKGIGVDLRIDMVEPTRFSQRAREKDFQAILWSFGANPKVDPSIQWRSDGQYNWFGYVDPETDRLIDQGVETTDLSASQAAFHEVQRRVHAARPATFLFWQDEIVAINKRFRAVEVDTFTVLRHAERWYVPLQDQKYRSRR